jgi:two-component system LytT family response regulator
MSGREGAAAGDRLRVLIADDELLARKRLTRLLSAMPGVEVAGECKTGDEVLARVAQGGIDVILLDIHMPGLSGLGAMALLPAGGPYVVFCTAHASHAVAAFDVGAVDYVLKPIEAGRLQKALDRARGHRGHREPREPRAPGGPGATPDRLAVSTRDGILLVDPRDVTHAVLESELVTLFTTSGRHLTDFTLQELEDALPRDDFVRVHRRAILNLAHVVRLEPQDTGGFLARTRTGHTVEVSRQSARSLRRRFGLRKPPGDDGAD